MLLLSALRLDVPVDPSSPQAQDWLRNELAKPEYQAAKPTWFDLASKAVQDWLGSLFNGPTGDAGPVLLLVVVLVVAALIVAAFLISSTYKDAIAFIVLLAFLLVRPEGLIPEANADRT